MRDLKSYLYAKFGSSINLEEQEWSDMPLHTSTIKSVYQHYNQNQSQLKLIKKNYIELSFTQLNLEEN